MTTPLLTTKLFIPSPGPDLSTGHRASFVPRPHLFEQLAAGLNGKMILISVPAGLEKSLC